MHHASNTVSSPAGHICWCGREQAGRKEKLWTHTRRKRCCKQHTSPAMLERVINNKCKADATLTSPYASFWAAAQSAAAAGTLAEFSLSCQVSRATPGLNFWVHPRQFRWVSAAQGFILYTQQTPPDSSLAKQQADCSPAFGHQPVAACAPVMDFPGVHHRYLSPFNVPSCCQIGCQRQHCARH